MVNKMEVGELKRMGYSNNHQECETNGNTYFIKKFITECYKILDIKPSLAFTKNLRFRHGFMEIMATYNRETKFIFSQFKSARSLEIEKYIKVKNPLYAKLKVAAVMILLLIPQFLKYIIFTKIIFLAFYIVTYQELLFFNATFICWVILSLFVSEEINLVYFAIGILYPVYMIELIVKHISEISKYIQSENNPISPSYTDFFKLLCFYLSMFYTFLIILGNEKKSIRSRFKRFFAKKLTIKKEKNEIFNRILAISKGLSLKALIYSRNIGLGLGIYQSLIVVNIPNFTILVFSSLLLSSRKNDRRLWFYYMLLHFAFLMIQIFSQIERNFFNFTFMGSNREVLGLLGLSSGSSALYREVILWQFLTLITCAINNWHINNPNYFTRESLNSLIFGDFIGGKVMAIYEIILRLFNSYMIWIFHITFNYLLYVEEYMDVFSVILFILESCLLLIHLSNWQSTESDQIYRKMYRFYKPMNFLIYVFFAWRYLLLFNGYSSINRFLKFSFSFNSKLENIIDGKGSISLEHQATKFFSEILILILAKLCNYSFRKNGGSPTSYHTLERKKTIQDYISNTSMQSSVKQRNPALFICIFVILLGLLNLLVASLFYNNINLLKIVISILPIVYLNIMYFKLTSCLIQFKYRRIIEQKISFFKLNFISTVEPKEMPSCALSFLEDRMIHQENLLYVGQMLKIMENYIMEYSQKIYYSFFYPSLIYSFGAMIILLSRRLFHEENSTSYNKVIAMISELLMKFYSEDNQGKIELNEILISDLTNVHCISIFLIGINLIRHFYTTLNDRTKLLDQSSLNRLIEVMVVRSELVLKSTENLSLEEDEKLEQAIIGFSEDYLEFRKEDCFIHENLKTYILKDIEEVQAKESCLAESKIFTYDRNSKSISKDSEKEKIIYIYMGPKTNTKYRLIYYYINKQKWACSVCLNALSYMMMRATLVPLIAPLNLEFNIVNLIYLFVAIIFAYEALGVAKNFEVFVRRLLPLFTVLIIFTLSSENVDKMLQNLYKETDKLSSIKPLIKTFVNILDFFVKSKDETGNIIRSLCYLMIGIGFSLVVASANFTFHNLTVIREKENKLFYEYSEKNKQIDIDYRFWIKSKLKFFDDTLKIIHVSVQDLFLTGITIYIFSSSSKSYHIIVAIALMFISKIFKKLIKFGPEVDSRIMRWIIRGILLLIFINLFFSQVAVTFEGMIQEKSKEHEEFSEWIGSVVNFFNTNLSFGTDLLLFTSLVVFDIISSENYTADLKHYTEESKLKNRISTLAQLYHHNDKKIYDRVTLMKAGDNLEEQIYPLLNSNKQLNQSNFSHNYFNTDIKEKIKSIRYDFLSNYYGAFSLYIIRRIESIYEYLYSKGNRYRSMEPLILLTMIFRINREITKRNMSLEDHICGRYKKTNEILDSIMAYYETLREMQKNQTNKYNRSIDEFKEKYQIIEGRFKRTEDFENIGADINSKYIIEEKKSKKNIKFTKEKLSRVADILFDRIHERIDEDEIQESQGTINELSIFSLKDHTTIYLHNSRSDRIEETHGFIDFLSGKLFSLAANAISTNIDIFGIIFLISSQLIYGGSMNFILTGIALFLIFVEEHIYTIYWWEIIQIIFSFGFILKVTNTSIEQLGTSNEKFIGLINFLYGSKKETIEGFSFLVITWLIFLIKRQGADLSNKYMYDNPALAIARVFYKS